jgi:hypothetical protein
VTREGRGFDDLSRSYVYDHDDLKVANLNKKILALELSLRRNQILCDLFLFAIKPLHTTFDHYNSPLFFSDKLLLALEKLLSFPIYGIVPNSSPGFVLLMKAVLHYSF